MWYLIVSIPDLLHPYLLSWSQNLSSPIVADSFVLLLSLCYGVLVLVLRCGCVLPSLVLRSSY